MSQMVNDSGSAEAAESQLLREAERMVVSDAAIMGGEPAIAGTRVPVYLIGNLAAVHGVDEAHATYPFLTRRMVELALVYATSIPRRCQPRLPKFGRQIGPTKFGVIPRIKV